MPAFFFNTDEYIEGVVMANYTSGAPVSGNLTLRAIIQPIGPIDVNKMIKRNKQTKIYNRNNYHDGRIYNDRYRPRYDGSYLNEGMGPYQEYDGQAQFQRNEGQDQYEPNRDQYSDNPNAIKPTIKYLNLVGTIF